MKKGLKFARQIADSAKRVKDLLGDEGALRMSFHLRNNATSRHSYMPLSIRRLSEIPSYLSSKKAAGPERRALKVEKAGCDKRIRAVIPQFESFMKSDGAGLESKKLKCEEKRKDIRAAEKLNRLRQNLAIGQSAAPWEYEAFNLEQDKIDNAEEYARWEEMIRIKEERQFQITRITRMLTD